jgi:hypothetical protein
VTALAGCLLGPRTASAEVTIVKSDIGELYVSGRVGAFLSYAFGDAYPVPIAPTMNIISGGGVDEKGVDLIPKDDAMGMPDKTQQGTISRMRVRSGVIPNVLTLGARRKLGNDTTFKGMLSVWGHIEPDEIQDPRNGNGQYPRIGRDNGVSASVIADFREAYLEIDGPWGGIVGGRFLSLFPRGLAETDLLYAHGYGLGFPVVTGGTMASGALSLPGPTGGMAGFGVLGATYAAGLAYNTPSLSGLKLTAGLFEPVQLYGTYWSTSRSIRPEGEITYDLDSSGFKMHLYADGGYQKLYVNAKTDTTAMYGAGYGARFEVGPVRIGAGGFTGKGVGLYYAFDGSPTSVSGAKGPPDAMGNPTPTTNELRSFRGFSALAMVALGQVDLGAGFGQTQVLRTDDDKPDTADSLIKTQTGISATIVYHATEALHLDLDFINTAFAWYGGEKQKVNFVNAGVTVTF